MELWSPGLHDKSIELDRIARRPLKSKGGDIGFASELPGKGLPGDDEARRRKRKWREVRRFYFAASEPPYRHRSLDHALRAVTGPETVLPLAKFISGVMMEFRFERHLRMDVHLRALYSCFDGADNDSVDYRDFLACLRVLHMRRDVRERPLYVFLAALDEFDPSGVQSFSSCVTSNENGDDVVVKQLGPAAAWIWRADVFRIAAIAAVSEADVDKSAGAIDRAISGAAPLHGYKPSCKRVPLQLLLEALEMTPGALACMRDLMWQRLPAEWRLEILAESEELRFQKLAAHLEARKLRRALAWRAKKVKGRCLRAWTAFVEHAQGERKRAIALTADEERRALHRWHSRASELSIYRRKREIAWERGRRTVLRRHFRALRRNAETAVRVQNVCKRLSVTGKHVAAGAGHLRCFLRWRRLRLAMRRWREQARLEVAWLLACDVWRARTIGTHFTAWHETANIAVAARRAEQEAERRAAALLEAVRRASEDRKLAEAAAAAAAAAEKAERKRRLMEEKAYVARMAAQAEVARRKARDEAIREKQREERSARFAKDRERRQREFEEEWATRSEQMVTTAVAHAREWLASDDREAAYLVEKELKETRRRFFAPPRPETEALERALQDPANVIFARVTHSLYQRQLTLRQFFGQFDTSGDGFLNHDEFRGLVHNLGLEGLSSEQIHSVLRSVDVDGSGFIDLPELEAAMARHEATCSVGGSPWKIYVHPIHAVMTLHNVQTDEEIWDYRATEEQLLRVSIDSLVGKEELKARAKASAAKDEDWQRRSRDWAARVLQRGQRQWRARKQRDLRSWRADGERLREKKRRTNTAAATIQCGWRCRRARDHALLALVGTIEKCCDPRTLAPFYFNHATRESSWKAPRILLRLRGPSADLPGAGDWSAVLRPDGASYWFNTLTGEVREPGADVPPGRAVCSDCKTRPAVKACALCELNRPQCFSCYRAEHVGIFRGLRHEALPIKARRCRLCNARLAERVCEDCAMPKGAVLGDSDDESSITALTGAASARGDESARSGGGGGGASAGKTGSGGSSSASASVSGRKEASSGVEYCGACWARTHRSVPNHRGVPVEEWALRQLRSISAVRAAAAASLPQYDIDGNRLPSYEEQKALEALMSGGKGSAIWASQAILRIGQQDSVSEDLVPVISGGDSVAASTLSLGPAPAAS